jgi:ubiquinone/menaquinone biosynthesis C-methylase UbiE
LIRAFAHIEIDPARDASKMEFEDNAFDFISESTLFFSMISDDLRAAIASEMPRVCRPGGYLVFTDWRTPRA